MDHTPFDIKCCSLSQQKTLAGFPPELPEKDKEDYTKLFVLKDNHILIK